MKDRPVLLICMGVSGAGKSTVARHLARRLDLEMIEADDFHGAENQAHMAAGKPLDDTMRASWIAGICAELETRLRRQRHCVLACSGLRKAHRQQFRELGFRTCFFHLAGNREVIAGRMMRRQGHFMPASLLDSQYADLDPVDDETDVVCLDINTRLPEVLDKAVELAKAQLHQEPS